ncbi:hypothetical protein F8388_001334 [Cannabis sativa]|uniref:RNase H type-1 domain-containing protein n=1 Tax=Cannabis sativa TaxID=3483 RepID=A0A7J6DY68_CANSA|nr:hypothetical protein F8388_001334 [Cannabis sativa]
MEKAMDYINEFLTANSHSPTPPQNSLAVTQPWQPPLNGKLKLTVNAALNNEGFLMGIGGIVPNSLGQVIAAISKPMKGQFFVKEIEAKAISCCLHWLEDINYEIHFIKTDALTVSQSVHHPPHHYGRFQDLIHDIIYQMSSFPCAFLSYVRRSANSAAHGLARYALRVDNDTVRRAICQAPIEAIVINELVH